MSAPTHVLRLLPGQSVLIDTDERVLKRILVSCSRGKDGCFVTAREVEDV